MNNITKDSHPGDETRDIANMVVQETTSKKTMARSTRRGSRTTPHRGGVEVLDQKKSSRQSQNIVAFGRTMVKGES